MIAAMALSEERRGRVAVLSRTGPPGQLRYDAELPRGLQAKADVGQAGRGFHPKAAASLRPWIVREPGPTKDC